MATFLFLFFLLISILQSNLVHAGAAVQQQQQMKAAREQAEIQAYQQAQQQALQQAVAERQQQAQIQAYQQQAAAYQAAQIQAIREQIMARQIQLQIQAQMNRIMQQRQLQAIQQEQLKRAVEGELANQMAAQIQRGQAQAIQQAMIARIVDETAAKMAQGQVLQHVQAVQQAQVAQALVAGQAVARARAAGSNDMVQDVVDASTLYAKLSISSKAWTLLIDDQAKVMTVNEFVERYRKENVKISKSPAGYAQMIDDIASSNPQLLLKPFNEILQLVAIMEYDFDNGLDKDMMARRLLGEDFYQKNRKRLGK